MSTTPAFAARVNLGSALLGSAETDTLAPAQTSTLVTAPAARVVADGVTTASSPIVTSATLAFVAGDEGRPIAGTNIPPGTTIVSVVSGTKAILSALATGSGSGLDFGIPGAALRIDELVVQAAKTATLIPTTVAGLVYVFLHDGTNYRAYDAILIPAITASATVAGFRNSQAYQNLNLKPGWSLRCSQSIAGNASMLVVTAHGAEF